MDNKLNKPILNKYMEVINSNELDNYLVENTNTILYVSVLEDSKIRDFEKEFKSMLRKNKVSRDILYMDITSGTHLVDTVVSRYSNGMVDDVDVPVIIVIEDGKLKSFYDIKENNYEICAYTRYKNCCFLVILTAHDEESITKNIPNLEFIINHMAYMNKL